MTKLQLGQVLSPWSNASRLRFDQGFSCRNTEPALLWTMGALDLDQDLTNF